MSYLEMYMWIFGFFGNGLLLLWFLFWARRAYSRRVARKAKVALAVSLIQEPAKVLDQVWGDGEGRGYRGIR